MEIKDLEIVVTIKIEKALKRIQIIKLKVIHLFNILKIEMIMMPMIKIIVISIITDHKLMLSNIYVIIF